ncbi:MAG: DUF547 domain-containing protein [Bacteroidota bacterium]
MKRFIVPTISLFLLFGLSISGLTAQSTINAHFFDQVDQFLKKHVKGERVDYANAKHDPQLAELITHIATASIEELDASTVQAFYINAYNLLVIQGVSTVYPISSVLDQGGFFDTKKHEIAGQKQTLNQLEKDLLLKQFEDSRYHFVLVCGAIGCPPITNVAYRPETLETQLAAQTHKALNNASFIIVDEQQKSVDFSQIFQWYVKDFGGSKAKALEFINSYRDTPIPTTYKIGFYAYDWTLNEIPSAATSRASAGAGNNASRYVVSAAIPKGSIETKLFNNLYTQTTTANGEGKRIARSTFFTSNLSVLYGINSRFNLGIDARYRRVRNADLPSSPLGVFGQGDLASSRQGLTTLGPKIRWAPIKSWSNFSIQSTLSFPLGKDFEGTDTRPYIDWNGTTWWTQFFNDISIGSNLSLFTEVDLLIEDIGNPNNGALYRFSTPATLILSYFPTPKSTVYALSSYSPYWTPNYDYFAQVGIGTKYQITSKFEIELLYSSFTNQFLQRNNGLASTFNIGIRVNR